MEASPTSAGIWSYETPVEFHLASIPVPARTYTLPPPPRTVPGAAIDISRRVFGVGRRLLTVDRSTASPPHGAKSRASQVSSPISPPASPRLLVGSPDSVDNGLSRRGNSTPPRPRTRPPIHSSASYTMGSPHHTFLSHLSSETAGKGSSTWKAPCALTGPERGLATRWQAGRITIMLMGKGGKDGGVLRVFRVSEGKGGVQQRLSFSHIIPSIDSDRGWGIPDVQFVHPSISTRKHGLCLRMILSKPVEEVRGSPPPPPPAVPRELSRTWQEKAADKAAALASSPPATFLSSTNILPLRKRQPSETKFSFGILPSRSRTRSKTVSVPSIDTLLPTPSPMMIDPMIDNGSSPIQPPSRSISEGSSTSGDTDQCEHETFLYLSFRTQRERDEWFTIFRALAKLPIENSRLARPHRRLKVGVLDLAEVNPSNLQPWTRRYGDGSSTQTDNISTGSISLEGFRTSSTKHPLSPKFNKTSDSEAEVRRVTTRPGWSWRERIRVELLLDNTLVARTAWTKAQEQGGTPFWGESFQLTDVRPFSSCTLHILKHRNEKAPVLFGKVDLPLVSVFSKTEDERYPVRSVNGAVIGEVRLAVHFQEVDILPICEYNRLQLAHAEQGSKFLYVMGGRGIMEGTTEHLCRIALCEGVLMQRTMDACTLEATSAGSTLFRSTTPLSKTMEVLLRMMCSEFLEASLGPTIKKVVKEGIEPRLFYNYGTDIKDPPINFAGLEPMMQLIQMTWTNMYANRHLFPNFIRHLLAHLFQKVREHHDDGDELLRYKAVSSFVFLRLIGPALMSPHLFNLADCLLPNGYQRTLTLVAKVLHQLAFFSDRELSRHRELALFKPFITNNTEAMIDYLIYIVTPNGPWETDKVSVKIHEMVAQRKELLPEFHGESIPHMTIAGAIDLGADWAICTETWYEKRLHPGFKLHTGTNSVEGIEDMIARYDSHLDNIHSLAFPAEERQPAAAERSITPCPSRPSLNFSVSTTDTAASSDDSHGIIIPIRRLFGFIPSKASAGSEASATSAIPQLLQEVGGSKSDSDACGVEPGRGVNPEQPVDERVCEVSPRKPRRGTRLSDIPQRAAVDDGDATPRRGDASPQNTPRAFPIPPDTPIQIVRRASLPPAGALQPMQPLAIPNPADVAPPEPTPKSTAKRRKRRPTLPHLFLGLGGKSNEPPPPLPPMPIDQGTSRVS